MRSRPATLRIGARTIEVGPRETLLQAARREGVPFPSSCRVGSCGTCRCRLVEGRVRELTETAYLLTADEIERGTILACQSVPRGDVVVEVDGLPPERAGDAPAREGTRTAQATRAAPVAAGPLQYLRYAGFHAVGLVAAAALLAGGAYTTAGLLAIVAFYVIGDAVLGDDLSTPAYHHPGWLTVLLWLALPLIALVTLAALWSVSPGDPLGIGARLSTLTGLDLLAARASSGPGHLVSAWLLTGLMIGMLGTIPAHELTHRTWDPVSLVVGRWLLAFSLDTTFAIEHVYGHHRYVSTPADPATAPRGRNAYHHVIASTWKGNRSAWHIEVERLRRRGRGPWTWRNAVLRGQLLSLALLAAAHAIGGWRAAAFFLASALWAKALLEIVNYMEHYGLVREPGAPVKPRHSWNTNRRLSSWTLFNLTRHSHHHAQGEVPFQDLRPLPGAPAMVAG
ncbi:MAG TPA: fatty acid desaturase, partial [Anaeromyxobacteraceae bacterium]|nr:fatty acid desaturase [Anaeromyxobacteraceae bacterium]